MSDERIWRIVPKDLHLFAAQVVSSRGIFVTVASAATEALALHKAAQRLHVAAEEMLAQAGVDGTGSVSAAEMKSFISDVAVFSTDGRTRELAKALLDRMKAAELAHAR